jgi:glycine hydroxymethyltransferase
MTIAGDTPTLPDLAAIARACAGDPAGIITLVGDLVDQHGRWNDGSLSLVASHNHISPTARALLSSSVADYIMSGRLGGRGHAGAAWIDAVDTIVVELARKLFGARTVEYRPMSGALANGLALAAIVEPGDTIMALPEKAGGHHTYHKSGYAGPLGLRVVDMPCDEATEAIDLDRTARAAERERPRLLVVGTAELRAPYPVKALHAIAQKVGARVFYDGAHILGLVAGGQFQDPLGEGADVLTGSSQKTLGGPIGGLILTRDEELGARIAKTTSGLVSNYHNNRIAALAVTLAEMTQFGRAYAAQVVTNAQALAHQLQQQGVPVAGVGPDLTSSHVVVVDATGLPNAEGGFRRLEQARILTSRVALPRTYPERGGIRLGTAAVTRTGMKAAQMTTIATLIRRVLVEQESAELVAKDVTDLAHGFRTVRYCFDGLDR